MQRARSQFKIKKFKQEIRKFYCKNKRDFPWRRTHDPYRILISEIMLQQTQVSRVLEKYPAFIKRFPTIRSLAQAPFSAVIKEWSGLGYNRRVKFLKMAAEEIFARHGGRVPRDFNALTALSGVGESTAGGVLAFAYDIGVPFIETNIRRVFIYHFFPHTQQVSDSDILLLVEQTLDSKNPREWYYALFDYGTHLAQTVGNPNRKSAHYTRQTRFACSLRHARGNILKVLTRKGMTKRELLRAAATRDSVLVLGALRALIDEGFVVQKKNSYIIRQ